MVRQRPRVNTHGIQTRQRVIVTNGTQRLLHQRRVAACQHRDFAVLQTVHFQTEIRACGALRAARAGVERCTALAAVTHRNHRFDKGDLLRRGNDIGRIHFTAPANLRVGRWGWDRQATNRHALLLWQARRNRAAVERDTCPAVDARAQFRNGTEFLLQHHAAAQLLPLIGKGCGHAVTQRAAWDEQQRSLLALLVNMTRRIAGFIFRGKREVANIGPVLNLLRLVERQHVQRGIALHQLFHVVFQQRTDNDARPVLLHLRQNLVQRLRTGVVDFQISARVGAGGCHGLRLRGRLSGRLC